MNSGRPAQPSSHPPRACKRLLLVSHVPLAAAGGASARWSSLVRLMPDLGWQVDVAPVQTSAPDPTASVTASSERGAARDALSRGRARLAAGTWGAAGLRPQPRPWRWAARSRRSILYALRSRTYDAVLATGPPMSALVAARMALGRDGPPLILEFRDLWSGNPAYDAGGPVLPALESWLDKAAAATICTSPQAREQLATRNAGGAPVHLVPNGFEAHLLERPYSPRGKTSVQIVHSGSLVPGRPLTPLLEALGRREDRDAFELVLQGYIGPDCSRELAGRPGKVAVRTLGSVPREQALETVAASDVGLVVQGEGVGDSTAIAAKTYEYLALGKPVLCISTGGATEQLLVELGAGEFCARLGDPGSIDRALDRLAERPVGPQSVPDGLEQFRRDRIAESMAAVLNDVVTTGVR